MKKITSARLLILVLIFSGLSCTSQEPKLITLNFEKDLFPEGFAIDSNTKTVYLNSLKSNKIVNSALDGSNPKTFLESNQHNYLPGFGMTIKEDTLYALGNSLTEGKNKSILLLLQLSTGALIESYTINDLGFHFLNDLAICKTNSIYITDSESNKIYKIQRPNKTIEVYLDNEKVPNSNGIAISDNDAYLYLATNNGIGVINTKTKKIINTLNEDYSSIDGLKFYKNNLYGIVNGWVDTIKNGLYKFELNEAKTEILGSKKLIAFTEEFKIPTTFDIFQNHIYFISNTHINNLDPATNKVIVLKKLESYKMIKTKVE